MMASSIFLIACHGGPADHFATYAKSLTDKGYDVKIHATGVAKAKFDALGMQVTAFELGQLSDDEVAEKIAKKCAAASVVLTDIGHTFDEKMMNALSVHAHHVPRFAYYDNPEPFVPGGYSRIAAGVIRAAQGVLFANANLTREAILDGEGREVDFGDRVKVGIGYYPLANVANLVKRRESERQDLRAQFLAEHGRERVFVYFGGNNEAYFNQAFPAFLGFLSQGKVDLSQTVILIQRHPQAKDDDKLQVMGWMDEWSEKEGMPKLVISHFDSNKAQVIADAALYYQTSMGPQFALIGIPTIQVAHETYEDILVRNKLAPSVTNGDRFAEEVKSLSEEKEKPSEALIHKSLGIKENWDEVLERALSTPKK